MKQLLIPFAALAAMSFSTSALAGNTNANPTHVVELFTSQGCSSCPPANRFATKVAEDPNTLVLSYGVTYWDFLGWKDTFGNPEFTQRQRDYRDAFGASNIYTPQLVLGGSAHSPRYSKRDVEDVSLPVNDIDLSLKRSGDNVTVTANAAEGVIIDVISFIPGEQSVKVKRGENGGRTLKLTNVVTDVRTLEWNGQSATVKLPRAENAKYAVLIHDSENAKILDAAIIN